MDAGTRDPDAAAGGSHYFDEQPAAPSDEQVVELTLPDVTLRLRTDHGVFGYGQVDAGTKLLLLEGPPAQPAGALLDLGCGTGAIALTLAARSPRATVWAVDINARARDLCRRNAEANELPNIRVAAPDDVPTGLVFDAIWSNPPIRIGKAALHDLLLQWLPRLSPEGSAQLVVSKHLGSDSLQAWMTAQGFPTGRSASRRGYRLLEVRRQSPPS